MASPKRSLSALALAGAVALAGCEPSMVAPTTELTPSFAITHPGHETQVCKEGPAGSYRFTASATGGTLPLGAELTVNAGECVIPWVADSEDMVQLTITEVDDENLEYVDVFGYENYQTTESSVTVHVSNYWRAIVTYHNADDHVNGRMTGGGHQIRVGSVRITGGLTLHCDNTLSNNLQLNWPGGNRWHLEKESLENIQCIDDPAFDETPPVAPFNTFIASAIGKLNGVDGSRIDFKFIDDGEPGRLHDMVELTIYAPGDPGTVVLDIPLDFIDLGNLQAHEDQPHRNRS